MVYYAMMALSQHYVGFAATNTELRIGMPPWGGVTPTLGNNPFSEQAPGSEGIVLPGELEAARRESRLQRGMPITEEALVTLHTLALTLGVPLEACR